MIGQNKNMKKMYITPLAGIIPLVRPSDLVSVSGNVKDYGDGGDIGSDESGAKSNDITGFNSEE